MQQIKVVSLKRIYFAIERFLIGLIAFSIKIENTIK